MAPPLVPQSSYDLQLNRSYNPQGRLQPQQPWPNDSQLHRDGENGHHRENKPPPKDDHGHGDEHAGLDSSRASSANMSFGSQGEKQLAAINSTLQLLMKKVDDQEEARGKFLILFVTNFNYFCILDKLAKEFEEKESGYKEEIKELKAKLHVYEEKVLSFISKPAESTREVKNLFFTLNSKN